MSAQPRQMPFDLDHRPALGRAAFLVAPSNHGAVDTIGAWRDWPGRRMALIGPARSGKTHLAHVWMQESGAGTLGAMDLANAEPARVAMDDAVVVEDVDRLAQLDGAERQAAEEALFHLMNLAANDGVWLLLTGRSAPARWAVQLPDLASRLAALPIATLAEPDNMLLSTLMVKLFADRQLRVAPAAIEYLVRRIERSCAAAEAIVMRLDRLSLERQKPVTRAMAAEMLAEMINAESNSEASGD